jgi:flagellar biosynthesis GTPase FlhF
LNKDITPAPEEAPVSQEVHQDQRLLLPEVWSSALASSETTLNARSNEIASNEIAFPEKMPNIRDSMKGITGQARPVESSREDDPTPVTMLPKPRLVETPLPEPVPDLPTVQPTPLRRESVFELMVKKELIETEPVKNWEKSLLEMDVDEGIVNILLSALPDHLSPVTGGAENGYEDLRRRAVQLMEPAYEPTQQARVLTFIGPAGVGKTTTLAKIATLLSMNDEKKLAMIAVQAYRLGASQQLQVYGDFLNLPVDVVMTPGELAQALEKHRDKDYILIDTAGRNASNSGLLLELKSFIKTVTEPQEVYLVLSLTTKNRDLHRTIHEFLRVGCTKMIFTKVDETETYGSLLNMVVTHGLPVAYLADGQGIPDFINEASPKSIADLLLREIRSSKF